MHKRLLYILAITFLTGSFLSSCKEEDLDNIEQYKIKAVIYDYYKSTNFDQIERSDTTTINIDSFLNVLRNDPYSSTPNTVTHINNNLSCVVIQDLIEPTNYSIFTTNNKIDNLYSYAGLGSAGQYGSYTISNNYTYQNNKLDSLNLSYYTSFYNDYNEIRIKNFKCSYNNNLLISFTGTDSLDYHENFNYITYFKSVICNLSYPNSYPNPQNKIHLDINDLVLNNAFLGYGKIDDRFVIQQLATYSTQSEFLIEQVHYNYYNHNAFDISNKTLDLAIEYSFDNLNRVQSFIIKTFENSMLTIKVRYSIIYE